MTVNLNQSKYIGSVPDPERSALQAQLAQDSTAAVAIPSSEIITGLKGAAATPYPTSEEYSLSTIQRKKHDPSLSLFDTSRSKNNIDTSFFISKLIEAVGNFNRQLSDIGAAVGLEFENELERYRKFAVDMRPQLEQAALKSKKNGQQWQDCLNMINYIASSFSLIVGVGLLLQHDSPSRYAHCFLAAGTLNVANQAILKQGGWDYVAKQLTADPQKQQELIRGFTLGTDVAVSLAAIYSGVELAKSSYKLANLPQRLTSFFNQTLQVARLAASAKISVAEKARRNT